MSDLGRDGERDEVISAEHTAHNPPGPPSALQLGQEPCRRAGRVVVGTLLCPIVQATMFPSFFFVGSCSDKAKRNADRHTHVCPRAEVRGLL